MLGDLGDSIPGLDAAAIAALRRRKRGGRKHKGPFRRVLAVPDLILEFHVPEMRENALRSLSGMLSDVSQGRRCSGAFVLRIRLFHDCLAAVSLLRTCRGARTTLTCTTCAGRCSASLRLPSRFWFRYLPAADAARSSPCMSLCVLLRRSSNESRDPRAHVSPSSCCCFLRSSWMCIRSWLVGRSTFARPSVLATS